MPSLHIEECPEWLEFGVPIGGHGQDCPVRIRRWQVPAWRFWLATVRCACECHRPLKSGGPAAEKGVA